MDKKDFQKGRRDFIKKGLAGAAVLFTLSPLKRLEASTKLAEEEPKKEE